VNYPPRIPNAGVGKIGIFRALKQQEIETLTSHRIHGIKIYLNDENLAQDIAKALKR